MNDWSSPGRAPIPSLEGIPALFSLTRKPFPRTENHDKQPSFKNSTLPHPYLNFKVRFGQD